VLLAGWVVDRDEGITYGGCWKPVFVWGPGRGGVRELGDLRTCDDPLEPDPSAREERPEPDCGC